MKAFVEYITAQINSRVSGIKTVRPWNNQLLHSNETNNRSDRSNGGRFGFRNEKPFKYPACFIEIITQDVLNFPLGITDYLLTVRFRFGVESYKFVRLDTFDFCDDFLAVMHLLCPTEASELTFTSFQLMASEFDEDHNNVEAPYIDYRTRYRHIPSYTRRTDAVHEGIVPVVTGDIAISVSGYTADSTEITADTTEVTADQI